MKKIKIYEIAMQTIKMARFRSVAMVCFVALLSASMFVSSILTFNINDSIAKASERMGADIIVIPKGYEKELQAAMFTGAPSTIYFDRSWTEKLSKVEGVRRASPQLYLATMTDSVCCVGGNQLIVFDEKTDFIVSPWLKEVNDISLEKGQVIVGDKIFLEEGETVTFFDYEMTIKKKMEATNMTYDSSVFMSFETAQELLETDSAKKNLHIENPEDMISMVTIDVADGYDIDDIKREIQYAYAGEGVEVATANSLVSNSTSSLSSLRFYGSLIISLLFVMTLLAMMVIFGLTVNQRKREFGILYVIGLKSSQLFAVILMEAGFISFLGGVLGSVGSWILMNLFKNLIITKLSFSSLNLMGFQVFAIGVSCILISVFAGILASFHEAIKIGKEEPYNLIKEN